jgi:hypothetical protein
VNLNVHIVVTERDMEVLLGCYRNGFLTFSQIQSRIFPGNQATTICNRLSKLKVAGLIGSQRIGTQLHHGRARRIGVVYQVTKPGLRLLRARHPEETFRDEPVPLNSSSLSHDLLLTDVIPFIERRYPGGQVVHGKLIPGGETRRPRLPDAVIMFRGVRQKVAVELELTTKSDRRYRDIITSYRLSPEWSEVLYVVSGLPIARKIQAQILGHKVHEHGPKVVTGKFHFVTLQDLMNPTNSAGVTPSEKEFKHVS